MSTCCLLNWTSLILLPLGLLADELQRLPITGAEPIDSGSSYYQSGGGPVGDSEPERGPGRRLVSSDALNAVLDLRGNSIVVDLGQIQQVERLALHAPEGKQEPFTNLLQSGVALYESVDNERYRRVERVEINPQVDDADRPVLYLEGFRLETRYLKVHSLYRGDEFRLLLLARDLVTPWGASGPLVGERVRLSPHLLQQGKNTLQLNTSHFRPRRRHDFEIALLPYLHGGAEPLYRERKRLRGEKRRAPWREVTFTLPKLSPGMYRLRVRNLNADGTLCYWEEVADVYVASTLHREVSDSGTLPAGEALALRLPEPLALEPGEAVTLPLEMAQGDYALYLGVEGNAIGVDVVHGEARFNITAQKKGPKEAEREAFGGFLSMKEAGRITLSNAKERLKVTSIRVLSLTPKERQLVFEKRQRSFEGKKLIFYNDGYSIHGRFDRPANYTADHFRAYADTFKGSNAMVERFDFSQGASSMITSHHSRHPLTEPPGKEGKFYTNYSRHVSENFREHFLEKGINPIEVMAQQLHRHGIPLFVGYRMNAWYDAPMDQFYVARYWRERPQWRVQPYRGKVYAARSYVYPEVRRFHLEMIKEYLDLGVDGVHLEFMRHPPFVGYDAPLVEAFKKEYGVSPLDPDFSQWKEWRKAQSAVMTNWMREVRSLLNREGRRYPLTVRFDHRNYAGQALDVEQWVKEGLIDAIMPGDYTIRNHPIDLAPFRRMIKGTKVKLYSSHSPEETGTRDPTAEDDAKGEMPPQGAVPHDDIKAFLIDAFRQGASGVYMFNNGGVGPHHSWKRLEELERWDVYENPAHFTPPRMP